MGESNGTANTTYASFQDLGSQAGSTLYTLQGKTFDKVVVCIVQLLPEQATKKP
jgi:hypothetical protein